jgi:hypothetical protein
LTPTAITTQMLRTRPPSRTFIVSASAWTNRYGPLSRGRKRNASTWVSSSPASAETCDFEIRRGRRLPPPTPPLPPRGAGAVPAGGGARHRPRRDRHRRGPRLRPRRHGTRCARDRLARAGLRPCAEPIPLPTSSSSSSATETQSSVAEICRCRPVRTCRMHPYGERGHTPRATRQLYKILPKNVDRFRSPGTDTFVARRDAHPAGRKLKE